MRAFAILILIVVAVASPAIGTSVRHVEEPYHQLASARLWCGYAPLGVDVSAPQRIEGCFPVLPWERTVTIHLDDAIVGSRPEFYVSVESEDSLMGFGVYACGEVEIELPSWAGWVSVYPDPFVYSLPLPGHPPQPDCLSGSTTGTVTLDFSA